MPVCKGGGEVQRGALVSSRRPGKLQPAVLRQSAHGSDARAPREGGSAPSIKGSDGLLPPHLVASQNVTFSFGEIACRS